MRERVRNAIIQKVATLKGVAPEEVTEDTALDAIELIAIMVFLVFDFQITRSFGFRTPNRVGHVIAQVIDIVER